MLKSNEYHYFKVVEEDMSQEDTQKTKGQEQAQAKELQSAAVKDAFDKVEAAKKAFPPINEHELADKTTPSAFRTYLQNHNLYNLSSEVTGAIEAKDKALRGAGAAINLDLQRAEQQETLIKEIQDKKVKQGVEALYEKRQKNQGKEKPLKPFSLADATEAVQKDAQSPGTLDEYLGKHEMPASLSANQLAALNYAYKKAGGATELLSVGRGDEAIKAYLNELEGKKRLDLASFNEQEAKEAGAKEKTFEEYCKTLDVEALNSEQLEQLADAAPEDSRIKHMLTSSEGAEALDTMQALRDRQKEYRDQYNLPPVDAEEVEEQSQSQEEQEESKGKDEQGQDASDQQEEKAQEVGNFASFASEVADQRIQDILAEAKVGALTQEQASKQIGDYVNSLPMGPKKSDYKSVEEFQKARDEFREKHKGTGYREPAPESVFEEAKGVSPRAFEIDLEKAKAPGDNEPPLDGTLFMPRADGKNDLIMFKDGEVTGFEIMPPASGKAIGPNTLKALNEKLGRSQGQELGEGQGQAQGPANLASNSITAKIVDRGEEYNEALRGVRGADAERAIALSKLQELAKNGQSDIELKITEDGFVDLDAARELAKEERGLAISIPRKGSDGKFLDEHDILEFDENGKIKDGFIGDEKETSKTLISTEDREEFIAALEKDGKYKGAVLEAMRNRIGLDPKAQTMGQELDGDEGPKKGSSSKSQDKEQELKEELDLATKQRRQAAQQQQAEVKQQQEAEQEPQQRVDTPVAVSTLEAEKVARDKGLEDLVSKAQQGIDVQGESAKVAKLDTTQAKVQEGDLYQNIGPDSSKHNPDLFKGFDDEAKGLLESCFAEMEDKSPKLKAKYEQFLGTMTPDQRAHYRDELVESVAKARDMSLGATPDFDGEVADLTAAREGAQSSLHNMGAKSRDLEEPDSRILNESQRNHIYGQNGLNNLLTEEGNRITQEAQQTKDRKAEQSLPEQQPQAPEKQSEKVRSDLPQADTPQAEEMAKKQGPAEQHSPAPGKENAPPAPPPPEEKGRFAGQDYPPKVMHKAGRMQQGFQEQSMPPRQSQQKQARQQAKEIGKGVTLKTPHNTKKIGEARGRGGRQSSSPPV